MHVEIKPNGVIPSSHRGDSRSPIAKPALDFAGTGEAMLKVLMFDEGWIAIEIEIGRIFPSKPGEWFSVWNNWQLWVLVRVVIGRDRERRITVIEEPYDRVIDTRIRTVAIAKIGHGCGSKLSSQSNCIHLSFGHQPQSFIHLLLPFQCSFENVRFLKGLSKERMNLFKFCG